MADQKRGCARAHPLSATRTKSLAALDHVLRGTSRCTCEHPQPRPNSGSSRQSCRLFRNCAPPRACAEGRQFFLFAHEGGEKHDMAAFGSQADAHFSAHCFSRRHLSPHACCAGERTEAREGTVEARLHQAHRHGAARHCLRKRLLRGRRALRHPRAAGQLEGHSRSPHHGRARWRAHARGPAARRHHRLRHEGRRGDGLQHGSQRQRHHGFERSVGTS